MSEVHREVFEARLEVCCDGLLLACGAWAHQKPAGVVVFLHGMPSAAPPGPGAVAYSDLAETWAANGWIAAWGDLRSVRESPGFFSIEGWVRDAGALIAAAGDMDGARGLPLAVVATSAGGAVGAEAIRRGATADALVLLAAPAAWVGFATTPRDAVTRATEGSGLNLAPDVVADPTAWAAEFDGVATERSIAQVRIPTLIVHGTSDAVVPVDHAHRIAAGSPSAELWIIEGAEHNLRYDRPIMDEVDGWLRRALGAPLPRRRAAGGRDVTRKMKAMTVTVTVLVATGVGLSLVAAAAGGLDATSAMILVLMIAVGCLGIAAARRAGRGAVSPAKCGDCGGLLSPSAPYCKHCGAPARG